MHNLKKNILKHDGCLKSVCNLPVDVMSSEPLELSA
jgi:hypothetical protein